MSDRRFKDYQQTAKRKIEVFTRANFLVFFLALAAGGAWWFFFRNYLSGSPDSKIFGGGRLLRVVFFDVGQGDSALVRLPSGKNILIDAGAFEGARAEESEEGAYIAEVDAAPKVILPYLKANGINRLDALVISHQHVDHFGGALKILDDKSIEIGLFVDNGLAVPNPLYSELLEKLRVRGIKYWTPPAAGALLPLGDTDAEIRFFVPEISFGARDAAAVNNSSLVARLVYKNFAVLFTGDIETPAELELMGWKAALRSAVIKIPNHGSQTSSTLPFLEMVAPKIAVISCGKANPFGHPHEVVTERLTKQGVKILRTDESGTVSFTTDGKKYVYDAVKR